MSVYRFKSTDMWNTVFLSVADFVKLLCEYSQYLPLLSAQIHTYVSHLYCEQLYISAILFSHTLTATP